MDQLDIFYRALLEYRRQINSSPEHRAFVKALSKTVNDTTESIVINRPICRIDEEWVLEIERGLIHVEKAIKEERQFIRSNGEVLPIEKVRQVSRESVEHLARHSNLISREPEENEDIIPDGLYSLERLNDYTVYENRFLYMLLCYLRDFVTLRYAKIVELSSRYDGTLHTEKTVVVASRKISYSFSLVDERREDGLFRDNIAVKQILERITNILDMVHSLLSTFLMQSAAKAPMLKPPITKTNVLKMDKNFKGAMDLYEFIISYEKDGYEVEQREKTIKPFTSVLSEYSADLIAAAAFVMYEYGLDIQGELEREYEREQQRRRDAEIEEQEKKLELVRKRIKSSGKDYEEYAALLEQRIKLLEGESAKLAPLNAKIDSMLLGEEALKKTIASLEDKVGALSGELAEIEDKNAEKLAKVKNECDTRITYLVGQHNSELETAREELRRTKNECGLQLSTYAESIREDHRRREEAERENEILKEKNDLLQARLKALLAENGRSNDNGEYSDKESFAQLEREYEAFKKFYKQQWSNTKKKIRKELLAPDNFTKAKKSRKQEESDDSN